MSTKKYKNIDYYLNLPWTYIIRTVNEGNKTVYVIAVDELPGVCIDASSKASAVIIKKDTPNRACCNKKSALKIKNQQNRVLLFIISTLILFSHTYAHQDHYTATKPSIHAMRMQQKQCEHTFVVVIPSYNNYDWCIKNISSVFAQKYKNYRIIIIDDCSDDGMYQRLKQYIHKRRQTHRVTLIRNNMRIGALANHYHALSCCAPHEIIVSLDGDDWFAHRHVLSYLNYVYHTYPVWLTYGQFQNWPTGTIGWCRAIPDHVVNDNSFREFGFCAAQPRTYYVWLAKLINKHDLIDNADSFYTTSGDAALMFPMLEMCKNRFAFIPDIVYTRNVQTPFNDFKIHKQQQKEAIRSIRKKKPYEPLTLSTTHQYKHVCRKTHIFTRRSQRPLHS